METFLRLCGAPLCSVEPSLPTIPSSLRWKARSLNHTFRVRTESGAENGRPEVVPLLVVLVAALLAALPIGSICGDTCSEEEWCNEEWCKESGE